MLPLHHEADDVCFIPPIESEGKSAMSTLMRMIEEGLRKQGMPMRLLAPAEIVL